MPKSSGDKKAKEDQWPTWGWPAPRIDSARGLLILVRRLGRADKAISAALLKLSRDKSHPLRFNMGDRLAFLEKAAPALMWQIIDHFVRYERKFSVLEQVVVSLGHLWNRSADEAKQRLCRIAECAMRSAPAENHIFETLTHTYLFRFLRTGDTECEAFINRLIAECDSQRASHALQTQLYGLRVGGWLTAGDAVKIVEAEEVVRRRTWGFLGKLLGASQARLQHYRTRWQELHTTGQRDPETLKPVQEAMNRTVHMVDWIGTQLYFCSGAFADKQNKTQEHLSDSQKLRFWHEAKDLFDALASEIHPHIAYYLIQTLRHLLPCEPRKVFLNAARAITASSTAGYQNESLAVGDVVTLIQRALADHREIFQGSDGTESECLSALLKVLDLFVEAGWPEARQLTHRLEEIYR